MNPRGDVRAEKEKFWRSLTVLERIRRTVQEQEEIRKSAVVGSGERILAGRKMRGGDAAGR